MGKLNTLADWIGIKEVKNLALYKAVGAEFLGSLFLVLVGCGACLGVTNVVRIALTFGLTVATIAQVSTLHCKDLASCRYLGFGDLC